jgi:Stress responsive A/B Barrel Domain
VKSETIASIVHSAPVSGRSVFWSGGFLGFIVSTLQSPGGFQTVMYIHMFAFRWKSGVTENQKQCVITEIRKLQGQVPGLLETSVGVNISPRAQGYELGGVMKFTNQAALDAYGPHPVHQKLLTWLVPLIDPIEVDFEDDI